METAKKASEAMSVAQQKKAEDRIKAAGEDVKNYSVFQDWMNDMDLKNRITDKWYRSGGKGYPHKRGINLFAKGNGFAT